MAVLLVWAQVRRKRRRRPRRRPSRWCEALHRGDGILARKVTQCYFGYKGEGTSKGIVLDGEAELNELGSFRRYGLVDMVMLYWQEIGADTLAENPDYFQRAAADENIWFVQGKYSLACRKLRFSQLVWLAQKADEALKPEHVPKAAEHGDKEEGGTDLAP